MSEKLKKSVCDVCGKVFEGARHEGSLRLHKIKKHGDGNCGHANKRFLNPNDDQEARAMAAGYRLFCPDCGVVLNA